MFPRGLREMFHGKRLRWLVAKISEGLGTTNLILTGNPKYKLFYCQWYFEICSFREQPAPSKGHLLLRTLLSLRLRSTLFFGLPLRGSGCSGCFLFLLLLIPTAALTFWGVLFLSNTPAWPLRAGLHFGLGLGRSLWLLSFAVPGGKTCLYSLQSTMKHMKIQSKYVLSMAPATHHAGIECHIFLGCSDEQLDQGFFVLPKPRCQHPDKIKWNMLKVDIRPCWQNKVYKVSTHWAQMPQGQIALPPSRCTPSPPPHG